MEFEEAKKASDFSPPADVTAEAIEKFNKQVEKWGLKMPDCEPLVLDFGLGEFYKIGLIEYWIANEVEAGYCVKYLFVFDGQTCPEHHHREKVETFFIVKGKVRLNFEGSELELNAGDTLPVQCGQKHSFTGLGPALLLEVSKPCFVDDNYFENRSIPIGGNYQEG